jgi:acyl carrier protein
MNLDDALDPDEEWDSLDHLSIIAQLSSIEGAIPQDVDLSSLTTFNLLSKALCD